jgi:DNA-binding NtrC family response regulator
MTTRLLALVSDDTELGRWALTHALEAEGFEVHTAPTWGEASATLARADFGLALLAVSAERQDAAEIADYLRRHHPNTHLILLADQDDVGALRRACGPETAILAKPLDLERIVRAAHACGEPSTDALRA